MNIGFAMCGSLCTFASVFPIMEEVSKKHTLIPILSRSSGTIDSRFGLAAEHVRRITEICGKPPLCSIEEVECERNN